MSPPLCQYYKRCAASVFDRNRQLTIETLDVKDTIQQQQQTHIQQLASVEQELEMIQKKKIADAIGAAKQAALGYSK